MALPPLWKVRRELDRIRDKTVLFTSRTFHDPIRRPIYDLTAHWWQQVTKGALPLTDRVAVFVVFQPKGIAGSILMTLDHLRQNGFSVLVVSNGPLQPQDLATLSRKASLVLERPNVGYDFGAYRDGIRHLWALDHDISRLVLMNDSTWFPLRIGDDSLGRMEALDADLAGHIFRTEDETRPENDHVESHLLMISGAFAKSPEFREFWSGFRMSDHRSTTILVGEKGFTQMARRSGRRISTLMSREWLLGVLQELEEPSLRMVLNHTLDGFRNRQPDASRVRRVASAGQPWRKAYMDWTDTSLRNSRAFLLSAAFVMPALVYGGMGFFKKANDIRFHMARQKLLDLESGGMIPPLDDAVRAEIAQLVRSWVPPKGQDVMPRQHSPVPVQLSH